ncbi:MAG: hypothetical protein ABSF92_01240 [Candidatus Acidiferrales bacterium]
MTSTKKQSIGQIVQLAGVVSLAAAAAMSLHHIPIAVALIGGAAAYLIGRKLRTAA